MNNARISPLLIPHFLDLSPVELSLLIQGNGIRSKNAFYGSLNTQRIGSENIEPSRLGDSYFEDGRLVGKTQNNNTKMSQFLIGASLDLFYDLPCFHRTTIESISGNSITFVCLDPYVSYDDIPRHTAESIAARERRQAVEVLLCSKLHWMTKRVLDKMSPKNIIDIDLRNLFHYDGEISLKGTEISSKEKIKKVRFHTDGGHPNIDFENVTISNSGVSVKGKYPETIRTSLQGGPASKIIDHWLLDGITVNKATLTKTTMRFTFKAPGQTTSYAEMEPEKTKKILREIRKHEESITPDSVKNWEEEIRNRDKSRGNPPEQTPHTIHFFNTAIGNERKNQPRIQAIQRLYK